MTLEEVTEMEKLMDYFLNLYGTCSKKYEDIKSEYSSTEKVNIEKIDSVITELIEIFHEKYDYLSDEVYKMTINFDKRILNE